MMGEPFTLQHNFHATLHTESRTHPWNFIFPPNKLSSTSCSSILSLILLCSVLNSMEIGVLLDNFSLGSVFLRTHSNKTICQLYIQNHSQ